MATFSGKVGLVQRVLPKYRVPFFNALGRVCDDGVHIFAGKPQLKEMIKTEEKLDEAYLTLGHNLHFFQGKLYLCIQIGLMDWLSSYDPDVLIVEANPRYLRTPAAIRWMHKKEKPVIGWGLGAPPLSGPLRLFRQHRRKQFIHNFDVLITYSQKGAVEYAALGFPEECIFISPNAVTPPPSHPLPIRSRLQSANEAQLLFVGRLQRRKNLDNLLNACSQLGEMQQPKLVIVGDGPDRQRLEALSENIYPRTTFTGALYDEALAEQFRAADLFVLPGTGGLAVQQAMSYGLPIIAAEADGTQVDLVRPKNGWQVLSDNVPALKSTLAEALNDLPNLQKKGAESYRIVSEEINLDRMVSVFVDALGRSKR